MCPPACSDQEPERTVIDRGLTGNLISTLLGVTRNAYARFGPELTVQALSGSRTGQAPLDDPGSAGIWASRQTPTTRMVSPSSR